MENLDSSSQLLLKTLAKHSYKQQALRNTKICLLTVINIFDCIFVQNNETISSMAWEPSKFEQAVPSTPTVGRGRVAVAAQAPSCAALCVRSCIPHATCACTSPRTTAELLPGPSAPACPAHSRLPGAAMQTCSACLDAPWGIDPAYLWPLQRRSIRSCFLKS